MFAKHVLWGLGLMVVAGPVAAQGSDRDRSEQTAVSLLVGPSRYDIGGTGTGFAAGLRLNLASRGSIMVEPGIGFMRFTNQFGDRISYLLPEISFQVRPGPGRVVPYLGGGAGITEYLSGRGTTFFTLHAAAGVMAFITEDWGVRADVRARTIDPFRQKVLDLTFGVSKRIGR